MTVISGGGADGGGVTGENAAKPMTSARDCVSISGGVKLLDPVEETSG